MDKYDLRIRLYLKRIDKSHIKYLVRKDMGT